MLNLPVKLPDILRTQEEIMATWEGGISKPLVSVQCITFNHASFIEEAIKGFLIQKTIFPVEVWIHDDASTDGTREIVEHYQRRYPQIIRAILQDENQYSKGNKAAEILLKKSVGKYIASCEGDDYWTDPDKLQKQVNFLEANSDYAISGHDAFVIDERGDLIKSSKLPDSFKRDFSAKEVSEGKTWILTLSWMYRNVIEEYAPERKMVVNGDDFFTSIIGNYGKSHYHRDILPAAYRIHPGGVWSGTDSVTKQDNRTNTWFWIYRYYKRKGDERLAEIYCSRFRRKVLKRAPHAEILTTMLERWLKIKKIKQKVRKLLS